MALTVLEASCISASPCGEGLDALVISELLVAVIDVATPKDSSPEAARGFRDEMVAGLEDLCPGTSPEDAVVGLTERVRALAEGSRDLCAVVAVCDAASGSVWRVGDCRITIDGREVERRSGIEPELAAIRAALDAASAASGTPVAEVRMFSPGRAAILPALRAQPLLRNVGDAAVARRFGAIDGNRVPLDLLEVFEVDPGSEVVLATDGYLEGLGCLDDAEQSVRRRADVDPLLVDGTPTTTPIRPDDHWFDDRTYVRLRTPPRQPNTSG